jgi:tryptophan 2,3-dioxygenase
VEDVARELPPERAAGAPSFTYGEYLALDAVLTAQHPVSRPVHHDELLFIVQHQTTELWLKLVLHELRAVRDAFAADERRRALKGLARVKQVLHTLTEQWSVLGTLTPSEYVEFRRALGTSSGFQSWQYRAVEFLLGNKDERMLRVFAGDEAATALLVELRESPSVYDAFLGHLARSGHPVPAAVLERDVRAGHAFTPELVPVFRAVYDDPRAHWDAYEACEELVDLEDGFQLWRFRHVRTVERIIGVKRGTGGSAGVAYLRRALDLTFFPELWAVRAELEDR